jgi:hypothetical protein
VQTECAHVATTRSTSRTTTTQGIILRSHGRGSTARGSSPGCRSRRCVPRLVVMPAQTGHNASGIRAYLLSNSAYRAAARCKSRQCRLLRARTLHQRSSVRFASGCTQLRQPAHQPPAIDRSSALTTARTLHRFRVSTRALALPARCVGLRGNHRHLPAMVSKAPHASQPVRALSSRPPSQSNGTVPVRLDNGGTIDLDRARVVFDSATYWRY